MITRKKINQSCWHYECIILSPCMHTCLKVLVYNTPWKLSRYTFSKNTENTDPACDNIMKTMVSNIFTIWWQTRDFIFQKLSDSNICPGVLSQNSCETFNRYVRSFQHPRQTCKWGAGVTDVHGKQLFTLLADPVNATHPVRVTVDGSRSLVSERMMCPMGYRCLVCHPSSLWRLQSLLAFLERL